MSRQIWIVSILVWLAGCGSAPLTPEEAMDKRVLLTVADAGPPLVNGYAADTYPGLARIRKNNVEPVVSKILSLHRLKKISQWSIKALGIEAIVAEIRGNRTVDEVVKALARDERVESVQPVRTYDLLTYNDPYFHLQNASVRGEQIERIHDLTTGKDVVVAVVDTGVDRQHPELVDRIILSRNFVDHDQAHFDNDEHGTSVAGVIGATANNDIGIVGVAPEAKLMVLKACWQDSRTRRARCDSYSIMKAMVEALKQQPDVLNLSLAGPQDPLIERLIRAAAERGIIVVAAIDSKQSNPFPASMPEVIAVSAPVQSGIELPSNGLLAPGTDVLTTTPGATYAFRSGSSMATAYVSGVAALLKERQPTLSGEQLRAQLLSSSRLSVDMIPVVDICHAVVSREDGILCGAGALAARLSPDADQEP